MAEVSGREWPTEMAFMLKDLEPELITNLIVTHMDDGKVKKRNRFSPQPGFRGTADFTRSQRETLPSLEGNFASAEIAGARIEVMLMSDGDRFYPGYGPQLIKYSSSDGNERFLIKYWFMTRDALRRSS